MKYLTLVPLMQSQRFCDVFLSRWKEKVNRKIRREGPEKKKDEDEGGGET